MKLAQKQHKLLFTNPVLFLNNGVHCSGLIFLTDENEVLYILGSKLKGKFSCSQN